MNGICEPTWSFFLERIMLSLLQLRVMVVMGDFSSCMLVAHTSTSSTILFAQGRPSRMPSERLHHSSEEALSPCGMRRYLYLPLGNKNVVFLEDSSSNSIWKCPLTASIFANTYASEGIDCIISERHANG